jgi:hypothetical protein
MVWLCWAIPVVVTTQVVRELPVQKVVLREGFPFCDWLLLLECGNRQTDRHTHDMYRGDTFAAQRWHTLLCSLRGTRQPVLAITAGAVAAIRMQLSSAIRPCGEPTDAIAAAAAAPPAAAAGAAASAAVAKRRRSMTVV